MKILFIYSNHCRDCKRMRRFLEKAIRESGKEIELIEFNSETDEAVDVAIDTGIEDIPGCVIGETVMFGKKGFTYEAILNAINTLEEFENE
jgi:predicted DCC family thiol-disulfide oxidoreductase YuxK